MGRAMWAYVGSYLFSKDCKIPFWQLFPKFWRLLDGHVTLAIMAPDCGVWGLGADAVELGVARGAGV